MKRNLLPVLGLLGLCACEPPPVVPTADRQQHTQLGRIDGNVVVQSQARGNVVVFLYDGAAVPPPRGSSRPLAFLVLPREQVFGSAGPDVPGPFVAPFTFPLVAPGSYLLRGFVDADGCPGGNTPGGLPCRESDFLPWYGVTAEPNAGDVGGMAVDPSSGQPRQVVVEQRGDGTVVPATGISVSFGDSAKVPLERPSFRVEGSAAWTPGTAPLQLTLAPQVVQEGVVHTAPPAFFARFVDEDADGVPDDADRNGVPDLWPRVLVRKLADGASSPLLEENDLDEDGVLDARGVEYEPAVGNMDGAPDRVLLAAGLVPDTLIAALMDEQGQPRMEAVVPVPQLQLVVRPLALDVADPSRPVPLKEVPKGRYAITLVQFTGQTWRVPNELAPGLAEGLGLPVVDSQGFTLTVE